VVNAPCHGTAPVQNWWGLYCCGWSPRTDLGPAYSAGTTSTQASPAQEAFWSRCSVLRGVRVEFLLNNSGYPTDRGVILFTWQPWESLGIPFAITPLGHLYQSPPLPIPGDLLKMSPVFKDVKMSPVDMLEHRDTYGQAQVCGKGHQGSSIHRPCQPSLCWIKFWHVWNPLPRSI